MTTIHITKIEKDSKGMISNLITDEGNQYTLSQLLKFIDEAHTDKKSSKNLMKSGNVAK